MAEIGFYHLTRETPERALARLLGRTLGTGHRALVLAPNAARAAALDEALWAQDAVDFLPHGLDEPDLQPVLLASDDAPAASPPNGADFLFLVDGADTAHLAAFARVFDLFDGRDPAAVAAARTRWTAARAGGHALSYWREGPRGWEKGP